MLWFIQERKNREFDKMHPLLRNTSLDTWWSEHHCCVSCCRATQKLVSANFRSLSEEKNPTKWCGLMQLIKAARPMSVTCVLLEVFLLALGRSVASLVASFCAAVLQCGLLARSIEALCSPSILPWILCLTSPFPGSGVREEEVGPPLSDAVVSFVPARLVWAWLGLVGSPS